MLHKKANIHMKFRCNRFFFIFRFVYVCARNFTGIGTFQQFNKNRKYFVLTTTFFIDLDDYYTPNKTTPKIFMKFNNNDWRHDTWFTPYVQQQIGPYSFDMCATQSQTHKNFSWVKRTNERKTVSHSISWPNVN